MRKRGLTALLVAVVVPALAAEPTALPVTPSRLHVVQTDDAVVVEITAERGEHLAGAAASAASDRVEIPVAGLFAQPETVALADGLVKRIDIVPGAIPHLSIKLRRGRDGTASTAAATRVSVSELGLRVEIPKDRKAPPVVATAAIPVRLVATAASAMPAPAPIIPPVVPIVATPVVAPVPAPLPVAPPVPAPVPVAQPAPAPAPEPVSAPVVAPPVVAAPSPVPAAPVASASKPTPPAPKPADGAALLPMSLGTMPAAPPLVTAGASVGVAGHHGPSLAWLALAGLVGAGALVALRRRTRRPPLGESIRVISSRPLGPKTRLVLVGAGSRELLLSVGDKGARVLAKWSRQAPGAADGAALEGEAELPIAPPGSTTAQFKASWKKVMEEEAALADTHAPTVAAKPHDSPLVAGILKLRPRPRLVPQPTQTEVEPAVPEQKVAGRRGGAQ